MKKLERKKTRARTDSPRTSSRTNFSITDFRSNTIKKIAKVRSARESELPLAGKVSLLPSIEGERKKRRRRGKDASHHRPRGHRSRRCPRRCRLILISSTTTVCSPIAEQNTRAQSIGTSLAYRFFLRLRHCNPFFQWFVCFADQGKFFFLFSFSSSSFFCASTRI